MIPMITLNYHRDQIIPLSVSSHGSLPLMGHWDKLTAAPRNPMHHHQRLLLSQHLLFPSPSILHVPSTTSSRNSSRLAVLIPNTTSLHLQLLNQEPLLSCLPNALEPTKNPFWKVFSPFGTVLDTHSLDPTAALLAMNSLTTQDCKCSFTYLFPPLAWGTHQGLNLCLREKDHNSSFKGLSAATRD